MATKMTAVEITERINKASEVVRKIETLIVKRETKDLPKLEQKIKAEKDENAKYWLECDKRHMEENLQNNKSKLEEKRNILKKWQSKLEEVNSTNNKLKDIPEQLKQLQKQIKEEMIKDRTEYRDTMKKDRNEMNWQDFKEKYRYGDYYKVYYQTDEDIEKEAERDSKYYILNLIHRVSEKVGEITKWELWDAGNELNGWVWGTKGNAKIETILAGGYNVQCLHTRVLVK